MIARTLFYFAAVVLVVSQAFAHTEGITVYSTLPGSGKLAVTGVGDEPVPAALIFCSNGECLYESEEGAILVPDENDDHGGLHAVAGGTAIRVEIVSVDAGAALKVAGAKLDQAGESVALGSTPGLHAHVIWEIEAPEGEVGTWSVVFRFTAPSSAYDPSDPVTVVVSNDAGSTSTSTSTSTTLGGAACGNAVLEGDEVCDEGGHWHAGHACNDSCEFLACGDPDDDGATTATDALSVLAGAVGIAHCDDCICNVDPATSAAVTGVDALRVLRFAIALDTTPFACPPCGE
jgi:hypothetical protein